MESVLRGEPRSNYRKTKCVPIPLPGSHSCRCQGELYGFSVDGINFVVDWREDEVVIQTVAETTEEILAKES